MAKKKKNIIKPVDHIRAIWGLICNLSSVDQQRNNISLFNVIDQFNIPTDFFEQQKKNKKALGLVIPFEIVICWKRTIDIGISDEEIVADLKVKTLDPHGQIIQEILAPLQFPRGKKLLRFRVGMNALFATVPGGYVFQVDIKLPNQKDFKLALEIPFEVTEKI